MGRNPKPVQLHLLEGNKNRLTKDEIDKRQKAEESLTFASDNIRPPTWLNAEAKKVFKKLVKDFESTGLLVNVDSYALSMFCDAYSDYIRFTAIIVEEGDMLEYTNKGSETNRIPHPLFTKKNHAFVQMDKMMGKFGLSPVDRAKLVVSLQTEDNEGDNPFSGKL